MIYSWNMMIIMGDPQVTIDHQKNAAMGMG
jgi:hypothetical protein